MNTGNRRWPDGAAARASCARALNTMTRQLSLSAVIDAWRLRRKMRRMLDTMPPEPRAVFERIRFRDLSYEEIAAELAIAPGEVERLFAEGLKHMMRVLGDPATQRRLAQIRKAR